MPQPDAMPASAADALAPALQQHLARQARDFGVPGVALALMAPGRRAVFTSGEDAPGSGHPVNLDTWFSVASLGKHVTACAVLELAQAGRVDLASPIGSLLLDVPAAWADRSVLSLMQHTSGLPEYLGQGDDTAVPEQRDDFMHAYGHLAPAFGQGQGWIYTNTNYILLGMLVAQLSGMPYAHAVQALFDRAGCVGAAVGSPQWAREANAQRLRPAARDAASARRQVIGDGDVCFTVGGALGWLGALLGQPPAAVPADLAAGFSPLLSAASRATLLAPATLQSGLPAPYGCGWFVDRLGNGAIGYHGGHFDGWTAMALLNPSSGCGVVAMCNLASGNTRAVRQLALQALEGFAPGSTPLALSLLEDDAPGLTATAQAQLLRSADTLDLRCFADELKRVAAHGSAVRNIINLWAGVAPQQFSLVEQQVLPTHRLRRYRLVYPERTEHLLVGTTQQGLIYWAWPL